MNRPIRVPVRRGVMSSEIGRMQDRDQSNQIQRSHNTLVQTTTEGTRVISSQVANWPRASVRRQARWA